MIRTVFIGHALDLGPDAFGRVAVSPEHVRVFKWVSELGIDCKKFSVVNTHSNLFYHAVHHPMIRLIVMGKRAEEEVKRYRQDYIRILCPKQRNKKLPIEAVERFLRSFHVALEGQTYTTQ